MKKFLICIFSVLLLSGCSGREIKVVEDEQQITYEYETVSAEIQELDMRHWFNTTHRYEWYIKVYYQPYDLYYEENSWSTGAFNAPTFFGSKTGENVPVEICNTYQNGKIKTREIIRIQ